MAIVRLFAQQAMAGRAPLNGPVKLTVEAIYLQPTSWSETKAAATYWKTSTPDLSNILKLLEDSLNAIVWRDDAQVARVSIEKRYGSVSEMHVAVETLEITLEDVVRNRLEVK